MDPLRASHATGKDDSWVATALSINIFLPMRTCNRWAAGVGVSFVSLFEGHPWSLFEGQPFVDPASNGGPEQGQHWPTNSHAIRA